MNVILYTRVSTREQADSTLGLEAQLSTLRREAEHRGWSVVRHETDVASGKGTNGRPGLGSALAALKAHEADALVVVKLDRLSRSVGDFARLTDRARHEGWGIVALDIGIDMTTATGEMIANVLASLAQWERRLIGERTKDALAVAAGKGTRLGRPVSLPAKVRARIERYEKAGLGYSAIAARLNAARVPTAQGGSKWYPSTVRYVLLGDRRAA